ncbi:MAG TPA: NAD-binding protein, partial [Gemmatimonadales bacterium]|nr:NAD-binding protein [Gemmatimonadales bacterium]
MALETQAAKARLAGDEGPGRFRSVRGPWWRAWSWLLLTTVAGVGFLLAVVGGRGPITARLGDALALYPSGFPIAAARVGRTTPFLVAMYLAPIVTLWVTGSVVVALYARRWNEFRARRRRGHAIVCGLGEKGLRSARALLGEGFKVTCIELNGGSDAAADIRARGARVLEGDATQANVLKIARADRAAVVICACLEDNANATIASQVERLVGSRERTAVEVYVHIANPDLSGILRAPTFGLESVRLHFFNIYDLWGRALADEAELEELVADSGKRPHIVVVGSTGLARSLIVWAAQRWYRFCPDSARPMRITLIAADATAQCAALGRRYPALPRTAELVPIEHAIASSNPIDLGALDGSGLGEEQTTIYLCLFDDAENLSLALQTQNRLALGARVVVPASAWTAELAGLLLRTDETIRAVGYADNPDSLDVLRDSRRELMAREVHANYRAGGETSKDADFDWKDLRKDLQESNRLQVDAIDDHLRALWYEIVPLFEWDKPAAQFSDADLETLAQLEHLRWWNEKRRRNYVH